MADRELEKLGRYMVHIAIVDDFRTLKHKVSGLRWSLDMTNHVRRIGRVSCEDYRPQDVRPCLIAIISWIVGRIVARL
jgi:hypothetical protein